MSIITDNISQILDEKRIPKGTLKALELLDFLRDYIEYSH